MIRQRLRPAQTPGDRRRDGYARFFTRMSECGDAFSRVGAALAECAATLFGR